MPRTSNMDPMVPCFTGFLIGCLHKDHSIEECFRYVGTTTPSPDSFVVEFASGLKLKVTVTAEEESHCGGGEPCRD